VAAYTAIPQLLGQLQRVLSPRPYQPGAMFANLHDRQRLDEEKRRGEEMSRANLAQEELKRGQQAINQEQVDLQRRGQNIGIGRDMMGRMESQRAEMMKRRKAAEAAFQAALVQGDRAALEVAAQELSQFPGVKAERFGGEPMGPRPGAEELRSKIAAKKLGRAYSPETKKSLLGAKDLILTPTPVGEQRKTPGGWRVTEGGQEIFNAPDESIMGVHNKAVEDAFSGYTQTGDEQLDAAAQRGKQLAQSLVGERPTREAIDVGMKAYQQEAARINALRRTKIGANRPRGGGQQYNPNTTQDNVSEIVRRVSQDLGYQKAMEGEMGIRYAFNLLDDRSGLGDAALIKEFAKSIENGGRLSDFDVQFVMQRGGVLAEYKNLINRVVAEGRLSDEYIKQLKNILLKSAKKVEEQKLAAARKVRRLIIGNPLLEFRPGERERVANEYYEYFAEQPWQPEAPAEAPRVQPKPQAASTAPKPESKAKPKKKGRIANTLDTILSGD
jgi:hypothetical protein